MNTINLRAFINYEMRLIHTKALKKLDNNFFTSLLECQYCNKLWIKDFYVLFVSREIFINQLFFKSFLFFAWFHFLLVSTLFWEFIIERLFG